MQVYFFTGVVLIGLIFGSFLSVIVSRLDQKSGLFNGRSECPKCLAKLKWYDLVPIFSFMALVGKCRNCRERISFLYPVMELTVAGSFLSFCAVGGQCLSLGGLYWLVVIFLLLTLLFFDYSHFILPDKLILLTLVVSVLYNLFFSVELVKSSILTALALSGFFAIIFIVSRGEWMGFGDVKLAFLVGFILGYPLGLFAILLATWSGAVWGLGMILLHRANLKTQLPFGSFINGAAIILIIFNNYAQSIISQI